MADVTINDLSSASTLTGAEEVAIWQDSETVKTTTQEIANLASGGGYTVVTGTLSAGSTTLTLQDASITTSSLIFYGSEVLGVYPTAMAASTGSLTMTFEAQQTNVGIAIMVFGGAS